MAGTRKRSRKSKESASRTPAVKIKREDGPGLILIFNIHHATLDTYNINTKKYTSNDLELSTQEKCEHMTFTEQVFSGGFDLEEIDAEKGGDGRPTIPKEEILDEITEIFSTAEPFCKNEEHGVAAIVVACDFPVLIQEKYFEEALKNVPFLCNFEDRLRIMSSASAYYLPYFFDSSIRDFDVVPEDAYVGIVRQNLRRTDAVLFRKTEGHFKVVNVMNRFKNKGFNEEDAVELIDTLRTVQNNILADCFLFIMEIKKNTAVPIFKKALENKNSLFLPYESGRNMIIENFYDRMNIDLDIFAKKDDEQQKLNGRYLVTMQGNLKQISNQQRFIDKSRFPLKRAPAIPGKRINLDPYAETSMSPLQYIRFLRTAKSLPIEKQPKRVREQEIPQPGSPDEAPPLEIVEAMCADQLEEEFEENKNCLNFDDEWLKAYGEKAMKVKTKCRADNHPLVKAERLRRLNRKRRLALAMKVRRSDPLKDNEREGSVSDAPEEDEVPEGIPRRIPKKPPPPKPVNKVVKKVSATKPTIVKQEIVEPQPGPSKVAVEPQPGPSTVAIEPQPGPSTAAVEPQPGPSRAPVAVASTTSTSKSAAVVTAKRAVGSRKRRSTATVNKTETSKPAKPTATEQKPVLRRSTRAAAKTATAKIAIAHLPQKAWTQKPKTEKKKSYFVSANPKWRRLFPFLTKLEQGRWSFKPVLTHSDVGYAKRCPDPVKTKEYYLAKILYRMERKYKRFLEKEEEGEEEEERSETPIKEEVVVETNFEEEEETDPVQRALRRAFLKRITKYEDRSMMRRQPIPFYSSRVIRENVEEPKNEELNEADGKVEEMDEADDEVEDEEESDDEASSVSDAEEQTEDRQPTDESGFGRYFDYESEPELSELEDYVLDQLMRRAKRKKKRPVMEGETDPTIIPGPSSVIPGQAGDLSPNADDSTSQLDSDDGFNRKFFRSYDDEDTSDDDLYIGDEKIMRLDDYRPTVFDRAVMLEKLRKRFSNYQISNFDSDDDVVVLDSDDDEDEQEIELAEKNLNELTQE